MVIKYGQLGNLLVNLMYKDRFTLNKQETELNPDGSKSSKLLDSFLQNEPCLVVETTKDSSRDGNKDVTRQQTTVTVHCASNYDISKGDILILSIMDDNGNVRKTIKGSAGQPCFYPDHLQIDLYEWKVS